MAAAVPAVAERRADCSQFQRVGIEGGVLLAVHRAENPDRAVRRHLHIVRGDGQTFDAGLSGEAESIRVTGPDDFSLEVYGYYEDAVGTYTVTIEAA